MPVLLATTRKRLPTTEACQEPAAPSLMSSPEGQRSDLDSRAKVHALVVDFYREVAFDDLLGPMFGEVAEVDWATHIPKLIDYWCRVLLGQPGYEWAVPTRCPELNADLAAETGVG